MQFPIFAVVATFLTTTASAQATYEVANYLSVCQQGNNLFCSGNTSVCPKGKTDTFDAKATAANEAACKGLKYGDSCDQTIACV
ncbi:hypothetical protein ColLi_04327 [Colletotrichum liriopes]|uniref:Uncharacterized protein n=1 Tax=Colletotrichum liriopes TaxID=708192 RepID=A0AA37LQS4_9PEZI|nr:hypothetical protein ColLi_04327 [Colletotrichum liriopes]